MTKTLTTPSVRPPGVMSVGQDVLAEDVLELVQAQNYAVAHYGECHLSLATGTAGWDDHTTYGTVPDGEGHAAPALAIVVTASAVVEISTDLWISEDRAAGDLQCAFEALCTAGNTVRAVFALTGGVGVATATVDATDAENGDEMDDTLTMSAATNGGEWCSLTISFQRIAGASATNEVRNIRVEELDLSTLPDPVDS
jgi:hypothetical protein